MKRPARGAITSTTPDTREAVVSTRALIIGVVMAAVVCGLVAWSEYKTWLVAIGNMQIPPVAIALLLLLVLGNRLLAWRCPSLKLRPAELVVIYVMMVFAAMIASAGLTKDLYPEQVAVRYLATPGNRWEELFFSHIKPWLVPWDPGAERIEPVVRDYFEGLPAGASLPWRAWLVSTGMWLLLTGLVYSAFMGIAAVVYKLWADEEHLSFPLAQLPFELLSQQSAAGDLLRNKLLWIGFALPLLTMGLNGLHGIWPHIPSTPWPTYIQPPNPYNGLRLYVWFTLAGVGIFYLLPLDVSFSLWFFFLFARLQEVVFKVVAGSIGPSTEYPSAASSHFVQDQSIGVAFALVGLMVYTAWGRVAQIVRRQSQGDSTASNSLIGFRSAAYVVGLAFLGVLIWWRAAGGSVAIALLEFGIYLFIQAVLVARATSAAGIPIAPYFFTPLSAMGLFGYQYKVGRTNLALLSFTNGLFTGIKKALPFTGMLDAQNLADRVRLARASIVPIIVVALVLAILLSGYLHLAINYHWGGITLNSQMTMQDSIMSWLRHAPLAAGQENYRPSRAVWFALGAIFYLFVATMRRLYMWWPLNPLGLVFPATWAISVYWFPALVAWLLKSTITRYGGTKSYLRLRPLFMGLVFGEFFVAFFWTVISFIYHTPVPLFPWL